jgi:hypothetical protein
MSEGRMVEWDEERGGKEEGNEEERVIIKQKM